MADFYLLFYKPAEPKLTFTKLKKKNYASNATEVTLCSTLEPHLTILQIIEYQLHSKHSYKQTILHAHSI